MGFVPEISTQMPVPLDSLYPIRVALIPKTEPSGRAGTAPAHVSMLASEYRAGPSQSQFTAL
jgi:hypothetical protein